MGFGGIVLTEPCSGLRLTLLFALLSPQNTPVGTPIFIVNATDPDLGAGGSVLYSFQPPSPFFAIDSARGIVTVTRELDYEVTQAYQLTVNATVSHRTTPAPRVRLLLPLKKATGRGLGSSPLRGV